MKTFSIRIVLALAAACWSQSTFAQQAALLSDHAETEPTPIIKPSLPTVTLSAEPWKTAEPCPTCLVAAATLHLHRTGPTNGPLVVRLKTDGTATAGLDYQALPERVEIPSGVTDVKINLLPMDDHLVEGPEVVRASISAMAVTAGSNGELSTSFLIGANTAMIVISDDEPGAPQARLDITAPAAGSSSQYGQTIEVSAIGVWMGGEISQAVEFYDGDKWIGRAVPPPSLRPAIIPGLPSMATVRWTNPPAGKHVLTARTQLSADLKVASPPIEISVAPEPPRTVVSIAATSSIAEESSDPLKRIALNGEFTISRTGSTNEPLSLFVQYSGTASAEADYAALPMRVTIPAGAASMKLQVVAKADPLPEGIETLVAKVSNCPPPTDPAMGIPCVAFEIDSAHSFATVFLRDDGVTAASVAITRPKDGATFEAAKAILIEAVTIDLNGYISGVEFWDGDQKIGSAQINFIRAPDAGTPIQLSFEWHEATPGSHTLTARTVATDGTKLVSNPVKISVGPLPNPVVLEITTTDSQATETGPDTVPDPAVFTIKRVSGPRDVEVPVFYSISGSASNGVDYAALGGMITLPSGAEAVRIVITPRLDDLREGEETVVVTLESPRCIAIYPPPPSCYQIAAAGMARAVIRDGSTNLVPKVAITQPVSGAVFTSEEAIEIVAEARDADGYVTTVEFFADDKKIGEQNMTFIRKPSPGETQSFEFVWRQPTPGSHVLTARAKDDVGQIGVSSKVEISVRVSIPLPMLMVNARDAYAVEPLTNSELDTATFEIRRFGSTNDVLTVMYSLSGTAVNGVDYEQLSGRATIAAGESTTTVVVRPLADNLAEKYETVVLSLEVPVLASSTGELSRPYALGLPPQRAAAVIRDANIAVPIAEPASVIAKLGAQMSLTPLPEGLLHLSFEARGGGNFRVEKSSDFQNWETVSHESAADGYVHVVDEAAGSRQKFYRLVPESD